jgi:hypothetical protein
MAMKVAPETMQSMQMILIIGIMSMNLWVVVVVAVAATTGVARAIIVKMSLN